MVIPHLAVQKKSIAECVWVFCFFRSFVKILAHCALLVSVMFFRSRPICHKGAECLEIDQEITIKVGPGAPTHPDRVQI